MNDRLPIHPQTTQPTDIDAWVSQAAALVGKVSLTLGVGAGGAGTGTQIGFVVAGPAGAGVGFLIGTGLGLVSGVTVASRVSV